MEALGAISEGVWSSLNGGMYVTEEANFMAQLLGKCTFPMNLEDESSAVGFRDPSSHSYSFYSNNTKMSNYDSHGENLVDSGNYSPDHEGFYLTSSISMDHCPNHDSSESSETLKDNHTRFDLESMVRGEISISPVEDENPSFDGNPKKRSRRVGDDEDHLEIRKRNVKKAKTVNISRSSSSPSNSEDESNGAVTCSSLSPKGADNLPGKTRASRGTATDPQSLYARKRRERINERLRILQNIVPNGTKVDISTMLEEAVHYVKFLQLQIKLLSSDELWMYAPIAYNGMDINLETSKRR